MYEVTIQRKQELGVDAALVRGFEYGETVEVTLDIPYTLHPKPYTLHPTPYTLHPTPYTTHPTHPTTYTLHPSPYTLRGAGARFRVRRECRGES